MHKRILFSFAIFCLLRSAAQAPARWTSADMYLGLQKLNVLGSVLYVAAHPDDENTRLIAYLSKDKLVRTGYLALTRGDGGQNLIGDEQGIDLGLIRTQELLAARRIDGGEQFFSRAFDFGYSKNPEETFTKWDREKILADVVWVIRKFQPDVIITRFPTTGEGGHGHHTASAILAGEAFTAAADPKRFPEQLKYVQPWQAKRLLWNSFRFGNINTTSEDQYKIDVGGYNPLLGESYGEIAAESRSQHKSQGFGVAGSRGSSLEYFKTIKGSSPKNDLLDDIDATWSRVKGGDAISKRIKDLQSSFDFIHPEKSVPGLVALYNAVDELPDGYWKTQKKKEIQTLILQCCGLWMEAYSQQPFAVQGDSLSVSFSLNDRLGADIRWQTVQLNQWDSTINTALPKNENEGISYMFKVSPEAKLTQPYWLENPKEEGYYSVSDQQKIGQPDISPAFIARFQLQIGGTDFWFEAPLQYKSTDPVRGELYEPLPVVPRLVVTNLPPFYLKTAQGEQPAIDFGLLAHTQVNQIASSAAAVTTQKGSGDNIQSLPTGSVQLKAGERKTVNSYSLSELEGGTYPVRLNPDSDSTLSEEFRIEYSHIPRIFYFEPAVTTVRPLPLQTAGKRIGYITGAGDKVPAALEQMGYSVTLLDEKDLARNGLGQYDAIIAGVRAYNTNSWLPGYHAQLMKYVENGGNYIVQYNTNNFLSSTGDNIGPYPFSISRNRVTDEKAAVQFLKPEHRALNYPNKISVTDFEGWIQERSIYDAVNWDSHYEPVIRMHDPGDDEDSGALLVAPYGKGFFTYTGLVFFRELPAGVPGAYRLLANLIALNQKKGF